MASTEESRQGRKGKGKGRANALVELVVIVVVALGLALLIQRFLVKPYRIPSGSMIPTLSIGQRVLVDRLSYRWSSPSRGDVVVFNPPVGAEDTTGVSCGAQHPPDQACPRPTPGRSSTTFIKRVVGVPGDHLTIRNNHVYLNGKPEADSYINKDTTCSPDTCNLPREITVPPGYFFMMGDNRGDSSDSRVWGPVPKKWLIGRAFFTYWPPDRIGTL